MLPPRASTDKRPSHIQTLRQFLTLTSFGLICLIAGHALQRYGADIRTAADMYHEALHLQQAKKEFSDQKWLGTPIWKNPMDLLIFQEIIAEVVPDVLIETGTMEGGSALYFATVMDELGKGRVISIDIVRKPTFPKHARIEYFTGSSTAPETHAELRKRIRPGERVMVTLDSDHKRDHVLQECRQYATYVTPGSYMIVEDTNLNGHPVASHYGPGPWEALELFLKENSNFTVDRAREKFVLTSNPGGFLRRR